MSMRQIVLSITLILCIIARADKRALLIGIGGYDTSATGWSVIHGNNDVILLAKKLELKNFVVESLVDTEATKSAVLAAIRRILSVVQMEDIVYLHFSGHGQLFPDLNHDEENGFDQSFVCYDACFSTRYVVEGQPYIGQNHLIDDELFPLLNQLKQKLGEKGELMIIFDTCYSGGADRGLENEDSDFDSDVEWVNICRGTLNEFQVDTKTENYLLHMPRPTAYVSGGCMTVISACESDKRNYECREKYSGKIYGSLSYCISKLLDKDFPLSQWGDFFLDKSYLPMKVFRPSQHPVVEKR